MRNACSLINKKSNAFEKALLTLIIFPDADTIAPNAVDACIGEAGITCYSYPLVTIDLCGIVGRSRNAAVGPFKVGKSVDTEVDKLAILVSHQNLLGCIGPNGGCQHHHLPILGLCIDD